VPQEFLERIEIPLPPLSEQKKIVAYLDDLREKVEKLKQLQQKQSEELTELKNSILDKALKGELTE
jgi:type I restriction enzyme S subunit